MAANPLKFEDLGLREELLRAITEQGYDTPTPIQQQAIPIVLEGRDVLAGAQTGTGKTAGFTLPLLQRLMASSPRPSERPDKDRPGKDSPSKDSPAKEHPTKTAAPVSASGVKRRITRGSGARGPLKVGTPRPIRAVILAPTRELAAQVAENVSVYSQYLPLKCTVIFGGVNINPQMSRLRRGVDIVVATPGRLLDHIQRGTADLSQVEILVLDEADRMLDMGFIHDIRKVLALLPKERQNLLFSATFSKQIKGLASGFLRSPTTIEVARENTAAETVDQVIYPVDRVRKRELLSYLIGSRNWSQVLVFTRTKHGANRLVKQLEQDGLRAAAIHGNKSQGARTRALAGFKDGSVRVLVATDIAARGIDIDQLPHVVNFELPNVAEDYVHRIGRTGRAGNEGQAVSLVCVDEHQLMRNIERLIKRRVERVIIDDFEPDPNIEAEPIPNGRNSSGGGGGGRGGSRDGGGRGRAPRPGHRDKPGHEPRKSSSSRSDSEKPKPRLKDTPKLRNGSSEGQSSQGRDRPGRSRRRSSAG